MRFKILLITILTMIVLGTLPVSGQATVRTTAIAWSPNGSKLAIGDSSGGKITIIQTSTGQTLAQFTAHPGDTSEVFALDWHPTLEQLSSGGSDGSVALWDTTNYSLIRRLTSIALPSAILAVRWSPDGTKVAAAKFNGGVEVWSADGNSISGYVHEYEVNFVDWLTNELVISASFDSVATWPVTTGRAESSFFYIGISEADLNADKTRIARVGRGDAGTSILQVLDRVSGQPESSIIIPDAFAFSVDWSPDGTQFALGGTQAVFRYDAQNGTLLQSIPTTAGQQVAFSPDGSKLAFSDVNGGVTIVPVPPTNTPTPPPSATPTATNTPVPSTLTLNPVADAYVYQSSPTANFGTATTLRTDASPIQRSYLRFTVPALSGSVVSATLRVFATSAANPGYTVHNSNSGTWVETTINYNNAPTFGGSLGNSGAIAANSWTSVDITALVTGAGTYNVVMSTTNSTATSFNSREGVNKPELVIVTSAGGPTATPTPTPTATYTPTLTPTPTPTATPTATNTPGGGGTVTVIALADAYVNDGASANTNFGLATTLRTDASPIQRSYLRFTVPALSGPVVSATLRVWANSAVSTGYTVHNSNSGSWVETTINFNNAPTFGSSLGNSGAITANTWTSVNVTALVTGAGTYNLVMSTTSNTATSFSSREGPNPPQLVIVTG